MSVIYEKKLDAEEGSTHVSSLIQVGNIRTSFTFQWPIVSEEQYTDILDYYKRLSMNDPLISSGESINDYDYVKYYRDISLWLTEVSGRTLDDWLSQNDVLPRSIKNTAASNRANMLRIRINDCLSIYPVMVQYEESLRWQFSALIGGEKTVGFVEPGGWYRFQDAVVSFRFISDRSYIGKNDLSLVTVQFEVQ